MPQPPHSIQPSDEQTRHGSPPGSAEAPRHSKHCRSSSAEGSVKGKYDGRSRVRIPSPNIASAKWSRAPRRCAMVMPSSTTSPSTWLKTGEWVASRASAR